MSSSPSLPYGKDQILASITVEDYKVLSTARTLTLPFDPTSTIEQALQKISRKGNVHLQNDIKMFGLYMSKKALDPNDTFQGLGCKLGEKINLTLKRAAKTLMLTIVFEGQLVPSTTETCQKNDTIQKLIEQLAERNPANVNNKDDDSCALFLPTKKSKKGILLERSKTLKSYHLTDGTILLLKNRGQSELILAIEIENYEELQCARVITSIFNQSALVREAIAKIARRSNVFIDDIDQYRLLNKSTHKRLNEDLTLAECNLTNRDTLILSKKSTNIFGTVRKSSAGSTMLIRPEFIEPRPNVIMIGEKNPTSKRNSIKFYSQETELLFGTLSTRELLTKSEREELLSPNRSPSALDRPYIPTFPRRSLTIENEHKEQVVERPRSSSDSDLTVSSETTSSEEGLDKSAEHKAIIEVPTIENIVPEIGVIPSDPEPPRPQPKRLTKKPGALPKKAAKQVVSDENWKLVRIYQDTEKFWTLAINPECNIRDIMMSIKEKSSQSIYGNAEILEVPKSYLESGNLEALSPKKLEKDMKLSEIKRSWDSEDQYILLLRQGASRGLLSVPSDSEERPKNLVHRNSLFIKQNQAKWLNESDVLRGNKISKGGFAKVYMGKYESKQVAIKTLIGESFSESHIMNFKSEFEILCTAKSPYLVEFIGAYISSSNKPSFVMEFCANGSMYDAMNNKDIIFDWARVLTWMMQTVRGIEALHAINLVHRDIKSLNLLMDKEWTVKVCDFGLSRFRTMTNFTSLGELRGTMAYCAPEIFNGHVFAPTSDIYSLGVVLWELCLRTVTGVYKKPFSEYEDIQYDYQIIIRSAKDQLRPTIPDTCPPSLSQLIQDCWTADKDKRPSCVDIIQRLQSIEELYLNDKEKFSSQN